jgi:hypothetical protein
VREVVVGTDNSVWLKREQGEKATRWDVLDGNGRFHGWVLLPENFAMKAALLTTVWGVETGEDGEESLVRYRVTK